MKKGDHYYLLCPRALLAPSRWAEINPFSDGLSYDEQHNAAARLIILASVSTGFLTKDVFKPTAGGLVALGLLHLNWSVNRPDERPKPRPTESLNPLPLVDSIVPPRDDPRAAAVDRAFGTGQIRGDVRLYNDAERIAPNRRELHGIGVPGASTSDSGLGDEPMSRNRLFARQVDRDTFKVAVRPAQS